MSENRIQNEIRNGLVDHCLLFRANVGQAWTGDVFKLPNGDILIKKPRPFSTGLPAGFSDTFGLVPVVITQDMVGKTIGQFVAGEIKDGKRKTTEKQADFLVAIRANGGRAGVWRSLEDALATVLGRWP